MSVPRPKIMVSELRHAASILVVRIEQVSFRRHALSL